MRNILGFAMLIALLASLVLFLCVLSSAHRATQYEAAIQQAQNDIYVEKGIQAELQMNAEDCKEDKSVACTKFLQSRTKYFESVATYNYLVKEYRRFHTSDPFIGWIPSKKPLIFPYISFDGDEVPK